MGYCETELALEREHGKCVTPIQVQARARGDRAHKEFFDESLRIAARSERRGHCFVATLAFGSDAPETHELRRFRDLWLRRTVVGRWMIYAYYVVSRRLFMRENPNGVTAKLARALLRPVVFVATKLNRRVAP